jgi:hypothetical protein
MSQDETTSHRHLIDALGRTRTSRTPPKLMEWLRREVAVRRPAPPPEIDVSWIRATPLMAGGGVRGVTFDRLVGCELGGGKKLRAQVHVENDGEACAVVGRVLDADGAPLAASPVSFYVDRRPHGAVLTDAGGEFQFGEAPGTAFGVCVGEGHDAAYVSLLDLSVAGEEGRAPR